MYTLTRCLLLVLLAAPLTLSFAQTTPVMREGIRFTFPTERTDGTALPAGELGRVFARCGTSSGDHPLFMDVPADTSAHPQMLLERDAMVASLGLDWDVEYFCVVAIQDTGGRTGGPSNEVNFTVEPAPPAAGSAVVE